ncbi:MULTISPECIES: aminopeptidase P family protein [Kordiimonas]|jgi:Xaa-Pro aminopeptidase|uniref:aminopeptidase P family protein n=1 Tax=Kordiimonas TaxID=288021 RepID=UPI00257B44D0|nr:aminopeptidase P family protein [Kordiimonas sp. UBA4487]
MLATSPLAALRAEMEKEGVQAFLVPLADVHQGEYIAARDKRLQWLTGFTGSAGMAIVRTDDAAIFVDGRYTVQVARQVDLETFSHQHLHDHPPARWLGEHAQKGDRIAYDPWLHTAAQVEAIADKLEGTGAELVPVKENLIDRAWDDQPAAPLGKVIAYPESMAGESASERRAKIAAKLKDAGADALAITLPDNIAWLMNVRGGDVPYNPMPHSFVLLSADGKADWFIDDRKFGTDRADIDMGGVTVRTVDSFGDALKAAGSARKCVWIDPNWSPVAAKQIVEAAGGSVHKAADPVTLAKAHKNSHERLAMRAANKRDSVAWVKFLSWLDANAHKRAVAGNPISEIEAADKILEHRKEANQFMEPSFESISAADGNAALCHYAPVAGKEGKLEADTIYLLDCGGQYLDGTTDTTRTIAIGDVSDEVKDRYTRVLKGHIALATARFPKGTKGHQLDALARMPLWQAGLDYDHGTGHGVGVGLSVHEHPQRIGKQVNDIELVAGMTITNEPGYYEADRFGIRIENLCEIVEGEDGFLKLHDLTLAPIDTRLIDFSLLTKAEVDWLNAYHARVREEMEPQVSGEVKDWLIKATEAI